MKPPFQQWFLKVGWIKAGDQTILTLHKRVIFFLSSISIVRTSEVITHNDRIHITHDEHNTWNLHIRYRVVDPDNHLNNKWNESLKLVASFQ